MYEMKDEYLTGIPQIDAEHSTLFEIAEEAYQLYTNEFIPDKYDHIRSILEKLKEYTNIHFDNEEAYMESIGYKKMFTQKIEHDAFRAKMEEFDLSVIDEENEGVIGDILQFLTNWLIEHILYTDKQIAE